MPTDVPTGVPTGSRNLSTLAVSLAIFGLACCLVLATAPRLFTGPERPGFAVFLVAGVAVVALTAGLFGFIDRLGMGFGRTVLVLAVGYNALIAAVKLGLAPAALYRANDQQAFDASIADPNGLYFYLGAGFGVLLLYALVFVAMYGVFRRRFRRPPSSESPPVRRKRLSGWMIVAIVVVCVALAASFLWVMPVLYVGLPTLSYLAYVFSAFGVAIALALVLAAVLSYRTFDEVEKRAVRLGDATLLAGFFWLGLALIFLYHVMWVVFLLTLVSIWPFQTYTPK